MRTSRTHAGSAGRRARALAAPLLATLFLAALLGAGPGVGLGLAQEPGWCVQCHSLDSPQGRGLTLGQMAWQGPLAQDDLSPCPGLRRARREVLAAESRLAAMSALLPGLAADRLAVSGSERGLARATEQRRQALAQPVLSAEEVGQRLARQQAVLMEQAELPLREQQELRAAGSAWGLALMVLLALALAGLAGLRRLCLPGGTFAGRTGAAEPGPEARAGAGAEPLERVRRGELP